MKSRVLVLALLWAWGLTGCLADEAIRGLLLSEEYPTAKPASYPFASISWRSESAGTVQVVDGTSVNFELSKLVRVIYLDEPYWQQISQDETFRPFRGVMPNYEVVLPLNRLNMVSDQDLAIIQNGCQKVAELLRQYPEIRHKNILLAVQANLARQVLYYGQGQRKVNAIWMSAADYAGYLQAQKPPPPTNVLTTLDGKRYENYQVIRADPASLHILYPDGGATIPFSKLSPEIQAQYHYDPPKAAAFLQTEKSQAHLSNGSGAVGPTPEDEEAKVSLFLAQQKPGSGEGYRKIFQLLDGQKLHLLVTRSQVTANGVIAWQHQLAQTGGSDSVGGHPLFIVGNFAPTLDSAPFVIDVYPAGNCGGDQDYRDPNMARFVTSKLDYLRVLQINLTQ